jgi:hypothetical protein
MMMNASQHHYHVIVRILRIGSTALSPRHAMHIHENHIHHDDYERPPSESYSGTVMTVGV